MRDNEKMSAIQTSTSPSDEELKAKFEWRKQLQASRIKLIERVASGEPLDGEEFQAMAARPAEEPIGLMESAGLRGLIKKLSAQEGLDLMRAWLGQPMRKMTRKVGAELDDPRSALSEVIVKIAQEMSPERASEAVRELIQRAPTLIVRDGRLADERGSAMWVRAARAGMSEAAARVFLIGVQARLMEASEIAAPEACATLFSRCLEAGWAGESESEWNEWIPEPRSEAALTALMEWGKSIDMGGNPRVSARQRLMGRHEMCVTPKVASAARGLLKEQGLPDQWSLEELGKEFQDVANSEWRQWHEPEALKHAGFEAISLAEIASMLGRDEAAQRLREEGVKWEPLKIESALMAILNSQTYRGEPELIRAALAKLQKRMLVEASPELDELKSVSTKGSPRL